MFVVLKTNYFHCGFSAKVICVYYLQEKKRNYQKLLHLLRSDKGFKGTVVNRALSSLHGGSMGIVVNTTLF